MLKTILCFNIVSLTSGHVLFKEILRNNVSYQVAYGNMYGVSNQSLPLLHADYFKDLANVKTLLLTNDRIQDIVPGTFHRLPVLRVLHLSQNRLSTIGEGIFTNLLHLTTLNLDSNHITAIVATAFDNMTDLIGISITHNPLTYWDSNWFTNTPFLIIINMDLNEIRELGADAFKNFHGDRSLALNFNYNKIEKIDDQAFRGVKKVTRLALSNNRLEGLTGGFLDGVLIQRLDISHNRIRCVDDDDLEKIFVASVTYVGGNAWDCDCFRKVKEWTRISGLKLKAGRKRCGQ